MTARKNIIFIINSPFPYYAGGIETWLYNVSARLCGDHNIIILSETKGFYQEPFFQLDARIKVVNYTTLDSCSLLRKIIRGKLRIANYIGLARRIEKKLYDLVDNEQQYYVVALTTLTGATAVRKIRDRKENVRFICSARSLHAEIVSQKYPWFKRYFYDMEMRNLTQADVSLSNGYDTLSYFEKRGIKTFLMKNGIDIKRFELSSPLLPENEMPQGRINIVSVATLLDIKCISEMITATSVLVKRGYQQVSLILVGKGGQDKYRQQAKNLGVTDNVLFLGHKTNVAPYLQQANMICCLSGGGGLSMSALESMASGQPVIAWDTAVYRQFNRNGKTMELVEEKNCERLADAIEQIMLAPQDYNNMTVNAVKEAQKYDWDIVVRDFINYLK